MAPEEHDRHFDKALSRHLRAAASSGGPADLSAGPAPQSASCLDPETLAAYHERSLLPEEMDSCKEHIVACAYCQAILAQLEVTDSIPLPAEEGVLVTQAPKAAVAAEKTPRPAPAVLPQKPRASRPAIGARWRWLAPAGALAAGLLVWVAWHENQQAHLLEHKEVEMAKAPEPSTPAPAATRQATKSTSSDQLGDLSSKDQGTVGGAAPGKIAAEARNLKHFERLDSRTRAVPPRLPTNKKVGESREPERDQTALDSLMATNGARNQPSSEAQTGVAGAASQTVEVQTQAANVPVQSQLNTPNVPGPAPLGQVEAAKKAKPAPPAIVHRAAVPSAAAPSAPATTFSDSASVQLVGSPNLPLIAAPGTNLLWRAGRAGLIEFSSDKGASWSHQTSGVLVDLTAGSAPSARICWIVGRAGTILLTADSGAHWSVIYSPLDEDLGGVRASDALHATVWNLRGTKTFETTDGGTTWKPAASQ